jgi:hypothetical protein
MEDKRGREGRRSETAGADRDDHRQTAGRRLPQGAFEQEIEEWKGQMIEENNLGFRIEDLMPDDAPLA